MSRMLFQWVEIRNLFRFRLRSLMILTTLVCPVFAVYGWRERRAKEMVNLVELFNVKMDARQWDEAEEVALAARRRFPNEPVTQQMLEKSQLVQAIIRDSQSESYCGMFAPGDP